MKKRFFWKHRKSSALLVSFLVHATLVVVALTFVAVSVVKKDDVDFEGTVVKRPQMKLRKLQVPVNIKKPAQQPKLRQNIVAKPRNTTVDIKMPEIVGIAGGTGYDQGGGRRVELNLGDFDTDLFGKSKGSGNEFIGSFYDLKQSNKGDENGLNGDECTAAIKSFITSGWDERELRDFFKAPKLKYATAFMMPLMNAGEAPKAFDVENEVQPRYWICLYKGMIAAPETGQYRFCGFGDDVLAVRIKNRLVLDACFPNEMGRLSDWKSEDPNSRKFPIAPHEGDDYIIKSSRMVIGDWFPLRKGQAVSMEVLIGELPGGSFSCYLLIEQKGKQYEMVESDAGLRPVLPVFKTAPISDTIAEKMKIDPAVSTLAGPVFSVLINAK